MNTWKDRTSQVCTRCDLDKPLSEYYKIGKESHRYRTHCKECTKKENVKTNASRTVTAEDRHNWYLSNKTRNPDHRIRKHYKQKYDLTLEEYDAMLVSQNGLCLICQDLERSTTKKLVVDHDHTTGKVRGLLCNNCNWAIGLMIDNEDFLESAAKYVMNARFG